MKKDIYERITEKIAGELEKGCLPWVQEWSEVKGARFPQNAISERHYSGINVILLWQEQFAMGYSLPCWLTYKQALQAGGNVRKGEKGSTIVYVNAIERTETNDSGDETTKRIPFLKYYSVFNVDQCEGIELPPQPEGVLHDHTRIDVADDYIAATRANFKEGAGSPAYYPALDEIRMPRASQFNTIESFYKTAFHELAHWTGHKTRLDRFKPALSTKQEYAFEELVAELSAAFQCAEFGFDNYDDRHAGYIGHWLKLLTEDKKSLR